MIDNLPALVSEYIAIKQAELEFQPNMKKITTLIFYPKTNKIVRERKDNTCDILAEAGSPYELKLILIPRIQRHKEEGTKKIKKEVENNNIEWPQFDNVGV